MPSLPLLRLARALAFAAAALLSPVLAHASAAPARPPFDFSLETSTANTCCSSRSAANPPT